MSKQKHWPKATMNNTRNKSKTKCTKLTVHKSTSNKSTRKPTSNKSKSNTKKRTLTQSAIQDEYDSADDSGDEPHRKKRKPNRSHRKQYPHHTDEDIRRQLALERKAKNRKSAQESRERRKRQEAYLNDRLPKGLELKQLLIHANAIKV